MRVSIHCQRIEINVIAGLVLAALEVRMRAWPTATPKLEAAVRDMDRAADSSRQQTMPRRRRG